MGRQTSRRRCGGRGGITEEGQTQALCPSPANTLVRRVCLVGGQGKEGRCVKC